MKHLLGGLPDMLVFLLFYGYLLLGFAALLYWRRSSFRKDRILYLLFAFHMFNFYLIYRIFTVPPDVTSGNGNPHILYIFISALLMFYFCFAFAFRIYKKMLDKKKTLKMSLMTISFVLVCFATFLEFKFIQSIKERLYHPMGDWWYWWLDIHLNSVYFNVYTFVLALSLSVFGAATYSFIKTNNLD